MSNILGFREHLFGHGLSERTVDNYCGHIYRTLEWCAERGLDLEELGAGELRRFVARLPKTNSTRRQYRTALKRWWEWKGRQDPPYRAIKVPPKRRTRCKALPVDEAARLEKVARGWYPEGTAVLFGLFMALRREEIATTEWERFDERMEWYTVTGKRGVTADLPVHPVLRDELALLARRDRWIFPSPQAAREHVSPATVWTWVRKVADAAGIGRIHTHQLRHTALATMNDRTGDLRVTQEFARHADPNTTAIYTRTTTDRMLKALGTLEYSDAAGSP